MAKKNRYRWQNEKKHNRQAHEERNLQASLAAMKRRNAQRRLAENNPRETWGSQLRYYELVSMHPLRYREVPYNDETPAEP